MRIYAHQGPDEDRCNRFLKGFLKGPHFRGLRGEVFPPLHGDDPAPLSSAVFVDDVARRVDSRLYGALVKALSDTGVAIRAGQGIDADELASGLDAGVGMITEALQELQLEDAADEQEGLWRAAGPSFRHPARGRGTKSGREGAIFWQGGRCFREGARPVFRPVPGLECRLQGDDLAGTAHGVPRVVTTFSGAGIAELEAWITRLVQRALSGDALHALPTRGVPMQRHGEGWGGSATARLCIR